MTQGIAHVIYDGGGGDCNGGPTLARPSSIMHPASLLSVVWVQARNTLHCLEYRIHSLLRDGTHLFGDRVSHIKGVDSQILRQRQRVYSMIVSATW